MAGEDVTKATSKTRLESGGSSGLAATLRQLPTARAERRARRRLPLALPARITFESGPERETRTVAGLSSNLSSLGAYLISPETLASGQVVFLAFDAPPELCGTPAIKIQCQGEVLRTDRRTDGRQGEI